MEVIPLPHFFDSHFSTIRDGNSDSDLIAFGSAIGHQQFGGT